MEGPELCLDGEYGVHMENVMYLTIGSFRYEDEDEDEDEALCLRHNEIFKLFRLQLGRDDEADCNNIVSHRCHGFEHAHNEQKLDLVLVLVVVFKSKAR